MLIARALIVTAVAALAGCAMPPTDATHTADAAQRRTYESPNTGSLFGGGDNSDAISGANSPGLQNHQRSGSGH